MKGGIYVSGTIKIDYREVPHCGYPSKKKAVVIADTHVDRNFNLCWFDKIVKAAREVDPDLILFPGDIVDSINILRKEEYRNGIREFFRQLGEIAPVCVVAGNHDMRRLKGDRAFPIPDTELFGYIGDIPNVHCLHNESVDIGNFKVFGASQSSASFGQDYAEEGARGNQRNVAVSEDVHLQAEEMARAFAGAGALPSPEFAPKISILLGHSPRWMRNEAIKDKAKDRFDLVISGHLHNLALPNWLFRLVEMFYLPAHRDGVLWSVVCGPFTTFPRFPTLQQLYERRITVIEFT